MNFRKTAVIGIQVFDSVCKKSKAIQVPKRNFYSITYRHSGKISLDAGNGEFFSMEDYITIIPKGTTYITEIMEQSSITAVHFELAQDIDLDNIYTFSVKNSGLKSLFLSLHKKYAGKIGFDFECMSLFYEILSEVESLWLIQQSSAIPAKMSVAQKYILQNHSNPDTSILDIANHLNISPSYLRREFRNLFNCSPITYLNNVRIKSAKNMLLSNYYSVNEIARKCGFNSTSYFIQSFRKATGKSPTQYRAKKSA